MMKKALALLMAVMLIMTMIGSAFAEDTSFKPMSASLTDGLEMTTIGWFGDETGRAMLTLTLYLDYIIYTGDEADSSFIDRQSYVARNDYTLSAFVPHNDGYVILMYEPRTKEALYKVYEGVSASIIKQVLNESGWKYYENDRDSLLDVIEAVSKS